MAAPTGARPTLGASLRGSARLLVLHPITSLSLGTGFALSVLSVCCGIGVVVAPWLLCELLAVQLAAALGESIERSSSWLMASVVLSGAVVLVASVGWLTFLGLGTQPLSITEMHDPWGLPWLQARSGGAFLATASAVVALIFVLPFLYAPLILLRTRASLGASLLESARLVALQPLSHLWLALVAIGLQVLPLVGAAAAATLLRGSDSGPTFMLASLPLLCVSVPFGQGMIVGTFGQVSHLCAPVARERRESATPWPLALLWSVIVASPMLSVGMVGASLVRPSRVAEGALPEGAEIVARFDRIRTEQRAELSMTALTIAVGPGRIVVRASDGGGAGALPLRSKAPIDAVRLGRVRDLFGIELTQRGKRYTTWIDRAGVRLDDHVQARLFDRLPERGVVQMLLALSVTALALLPVMGALGALRRRYTDETGSGPMPSELSALRTRDLRRAVLAGIAVLPFGLLSLYWGVACLFSH